MSCATAGRCADPGWLESRVDPYRDRLLRDGSPDLDEVLALLPRPQGRAAFDEAVIAPNIERVERAVTVETGHPFLDASVKTGLAAIDATFQGNHPKYGVGAYGHPAHDAFPPTIIASADALSAWGMLRRAEEVFGYWLATFVRADGSIDYYGPSLSEYGQLLHTAVRVMERGARRQWWEAHMPALSCIASWAMARIAEAGGELVQGCPEADERADRGAYFHNNAWLAEGLRRFEEGCREFGGGPGAALGPVASELASRTLDAIAEKWPQDEDDLWLQPQVEERERPHGVTGNRIGSYTNYRYWPELLSSGLLPPGMARRVVRARLEFGGQFVGMSRFADWLDDWPLFDYLAGLHRYGFADDLLLCLYGHVAYGQAEEHLTAYEQVTFPPGREKAPYCLPAQLVAARAVALLDGR
jgi:hypothetical protein